jgi:predicted nucleic acid-binding protein
MRALLDTNVVLDVVLDRQPFVEAAARLWRAHEQGLFEGYIAAITPLNVLYIVRRLRDRETAIIAVDGLLAAFGVCSMDGTVLRRARELSMGDFEDAAQAAAAEVAGLEAIITRNTGDFAGAPLPIFSPGDFLAQLAAPGAGGT